MRTILQPWRTRGGMIVSEDMDKNGTVPEERTKLLFLAKRLADIAKDLDKITMEEDKQFVIERAGKSSHVELVELFNILLEYMQSSM